MLDSSESMKRASRNSLPSILDVPPAFLYYFHSSANAAAETLSAGGFSGGAAAGQREPKYEGPGAQTYPAHPEGDGPDAARRSENARPGRGSPAPNQQRLSPTEIHSSREARALPEIRWREWAPPSRPVMK